jgi:hypothetical protein
MFKWLAEAVDNIADRINEPESFADLLIHTRNDKPQVLVIPASLKLTQAQSAKLAEVISDAYSNKSVSIQLDIKSFGEGELSDLRYFCERLRTGSSNFNVKSHDGHTLYYDVFYSRRVKEHEYVEGCWFVLELMQDGFYRNSWASPPEAKFTPFPGSPAPLVRIPKTIPLPDRQKTDNEVIKEKIEIKMKEVPIFPACMPLILSHDAFCFERYNIPLERYKKINDASEMQYWLSEIERTHRYRAGLKAGQEAREEVAIEKENEKAHNGTPNDQYKAACEISRLKKEPLCGNSLYWLEKAADKGHVEAAIKMIESYRKNKTRGWEAKAEKYYNVAKKTNPALGVSLAVDILGDPGFLSLINLYSENEEARESRAIRVIQSAVRAGAPGAAEKEKEIIKTVNERSACRAAMEIAAKERAELARRAQANKELAERAERERNLPVWKQFPKYPAPVYTPVYSGGSVSTNQANQNNGAYASYTQNPQLYNSFGVPRAIAERPAGYDQYGNKR